jgi:hypothetical protein
MEELGLDRDLARVHCEQSKRQLLEAGKAGKNLAEAVKTCVAHWENRVWSILNEEETEIRLRESNEVSKALITLATTMANQKQPDVHVTVQPAAAPIVTITNQQPENNLTMVVPEQPAPVVNVTNEVKPTDVAVEVDAPICYVTNNVQPAAVDVNVNLPKRVTTTTVKRDRNGAVTGSEQIEEDA